MACTILSLAFLALLLHISAADTCKVLCLQKVGISGNHIVAYVHYDGSVLHSRLVEVVLNDRYFASISTNYSGVLSVYAPFSLGRNMVSIEYAGSVAEYPIYYFGNYLSLALLPIGIAFYFSIKLISEHITSNKEVMIVFDCEHGECHNSLDKRLIQDTAVQLYKRNARMRMVKALPVSVNEISAALHEHLGCPSPINNDEFIGSVCADVYLGVLCRSAMPYREIAAKRIYETAINTGSYALKDGMSVSSFLKSNCVIHFIEMHSGLKRGLYGSNHICIAVSTCSEKKEVQALLARCSGACAFMLFNELNGFMSVIGC